MIAFAGVVLAALATADEDAAVMARAGLQNLDVNAIMVQGNFAGHSNSGAIITQIEAAFLPAHEGCKLAKPGAGGSMEGFLDVGVVGAGRCQFMEDLR